MHGSPAAPGRVRLNREAPKGGNPDLPLLVRAPVDDPHLRIGLHRLGARGLVATDASPERVMRSIETLLSSDTAFTTISNHTPLFTSRDLAILQGLDAGFVHKEIADRLGISRTAMDNRLLRLRERFAVRSTHTLVALMNEWGLAHLPSETLSEVPENGTMNGGAGEQAGGRADGRTGGRADG